jgi:maltooligosyltrehalose synthase
VGDNAGHVIAFARAIQDRQVVVAIGRHFATLTDGGKRWPSGWRATLALPDGARYIDALTGRDGTFSGRAELSILFSEIPICVLVRQ